MVHSAAFITPVVEHWLEREIAQWAHHEGPHVDTRTVTYSRLAETRMGLITEQIIIGELISKHQENTVFLSNSCGL